MPERYASRIPFLRAIGKFRKFRVFAAIRGSRARDGVAGRLSAAQLAIRMVSRNYLNGFTTTRKNSRFATLLCFHARFFALLQWTIFTASSTPQLTAAQLL